jgi:hypothetical protein
MPCGAFRVFGKIRPVILYESLSTIVQYRFIHFRAGR